MRIFLLGFMGSGKSSLGKKLAKQLAFNFIDLDVMIERKAGLTINEIFENSGEEKFRDLEHECLKDSLNFDNVVIATGGGTPCFYDNMEMINNNGISLYIKLSTYALISRLFDNKAKRPLLKQAENKQEFQKFIYDLFATREKYYLQAQMIVEGDKIKVNEIIEMLKNNETDGII